MWGVLVGLWTVVPRSGGIAVPHARLTAGMAFTELPLNDGMTGANGVTVGPDGNYWVAASGRIDRVTPGGQTTTFGGPTATSQLNSIVTGPDGNLWFTDLSNETVGGATYQAQIGRITPSGVVTMFTVGLGYEIGEPNEIVSGPDGALWFTLYKQNYSTGFTSCQQVGRIATDGTSTIFKTGCSGALETHGITVGPDNKVWFTIPGVGQVGSIATDGTTNLYNVSTLGASGSPSELTLGVDHRLWFSEGSTAEIASLSVDGSSLQRYALPPGDAAAGLSAGPDGNMWFTDNTNGAVGTVDTSSQVTEYQTPTLGSAPKWITSTGSTLLFAEDGIPAVGLLSPGALASQELFGVNESEHLYCSTCHGDPIRTSTGNFFHVFHDLAVPGRGLALNLTRTYNAQAASAGGVLGYGWTHSYAMALTVAQDGSASLLQETGSVIGFKPGPNGRFTGARRILASLVKNPDGTYTFSRNNQTNFGFDASGRLAKEWDRNGYVTTLAYNGSGQLSTVTDPAGRSLTFAYTTGGLLASVTDPIGRAASYGYDGNGNLTSATDVGGGVSRYTYDGAHLMLTMSDPRGGTTSNVYDASMRVTQQTDPEHRTTTMAYAGGTVTITDPAGNQTVERYTSNELTSITRGAGSPQAATWSYTYDPATLGTTTAVDPNGHTSTMTWDARGNLLTSADALNRSTTSNYTAQNDLASMTDALGVTTTLTYDAHGNLAQVSRPLVGTGQAAVTQIAHADAAHPGDVTSVTDATGRTVRFGYDSAGDVTSVTDALGDTATTSYNGIGWPMSSVSPRGNAPGSNPTLFTATVQRNAFGNPVTVRDALGDTTVTTYDANQNVVQVKDPNNHVMTTTYDANNAPLAVTHVGSDTASTTYDADGRVHQQIDGLGHAVTYGYDALSRVVTSTDALNRTTRSTYDGAGNVLTTVDAQNQTTTYGYDAANQLTAVRYSDGQTPAVSLGYDADGHRTSMTDGTGHSSYSWDSLMRLTSSTNGAGATVGYGYDLAGRPSSWTFGQVSGAPFGYAYGFDSAGRVQSVTDRLGQSTAMTRDADGNAVSIAYPNGVVGSMTYDNADRLVDSQVTNGSATLLSLPSPRQPSGLVAAGAADPLAKVSETYTYDTANRVTADTAQGTGSTYGYDAADNRTSMTLAGAGLQLNHDAADELTSITSASSGHQVAAFQYDARGNRTASTTATYSFDQANRLLGIAAAGTGAAVARYAYDGAGLRQSKSLAGTSAEPFTWSAGGSLPMLLVDGSTNYVYSPDGLPLEQVGSTGVTLWYHHDQLGSTRALTTAKGTPAATYTYDALGNVVGAPPALINPFQFAGQYVDTESGLQYLRARYYQPASGEFLSRDPAVATTRSPYGYVGGNPLNGTDPSGLYSYRMRWGLGWWGANGAQVAMQLLENHPDKVFPFNIAPGTSIRAGAQIDLHTGMYHPCLDGIPLPLCSPGNDPVLVTSATSESFTFFSLPGHVEGPWGTITFKTYYEGNNLILEQDAQGPDDVSFGLDNGIRYWLAEKIWHRQAENLANALSDEYARCSGEFGQV